MTRVFVVAPAPMMRVGLRTILTTGEMQVVGEAARPAEFADELPDIDVIVLAEEGLLEELQRAVGGNRTPALVVLSSNNNRLMTMLNALAPHGWAVVPADASTAQLQAAVAAAAQGLIALPTLLAEQLLEQRGVVALSDIDTALPDEALTTREREVLELLSRGLPNKLIARRLQISEHTVKFHVSSIYAKLGATSRTDAVSRGVRRGLITRSSLCNMVSSFQAVIYRLSLSLLMRQKRWDGMGSFIGMEFISKMPGLCMIRGSYWPPSPCVLNMFASGLY